MQIQNLKQIKMPNYSSRIISECKNCSLCEKIIDIHKHNDIKKLLSDVNQWDTQVISQFRQIKKFHCLPCDFESKIFINWICHIMSVSHMATCHKIKDLYSFVCCNKECKILLYGLEKCILNHINEHSQFDSILTVSFFMAKVMENYITKQIKLLYYCSYCKKFSDEPIHANDKMCKTNLKHYINYFCKFCKVDFISSPEHLDYHSLTVEHMTLKCFDKLCTEAKMDYFHSSEQLNKNNLNLVIQKNEIGTKSIKLPFIIVTRFHNINQYHGECKLCSYSINWDTKNIMLHLLKCKYKSNITDLNKTTMKTFKCIICDYSTNNFNEHKSHIISLPHFINCLNVNTYYSYFCDVCNAFMYSDKIAITDHIKNHKNTNTTELPKLSSFMALLFKNFITNPERKKLIHYYGNNKCKELTKDSQKCNVCKIEFHDSVNDYKMHEITSEHIILKFLMTSVVLSNTDLTSVCNTQAIQSKNIINNVPLLQEVSDHKYVQNDQAIKNELKADGNCTKLLNKIETSQKPPVANIYVEELDISCSDSESNKNIEFLSDHGKQQYTKYYKHKINLLNLFQQYRDSIIKTRSFYCHVCDFITEEKYYWDKHNKTQHLDFVSRCTIYCSTCNMLIIGRNFEEHDRTTEHCMFFQFLQSFKCVEENIVKKTTEDEAVKLNSLVYNQNVDMKIEKTINYVDVSTSTDDIYLIDSINLKNDKTSQNENVDKSISSLCSLQTTDKGFIENRKMNDIHDNIAYGRYVTKRLNNIENVSIVNDVKLEIDNIFYTIVKQMSNNTKY